MNLEKPKFPLASSLAQEGKNFDVLLWIGCAGYFDARYKRVMYAIAQILEIAQISYAILGSEETCSGDPARRAGNEFLFQMQAHQNIQTFSHYGVKKIVAACPHCFNTLKNEYPELGGKYQVVHHTEYIQELLQSGRVRLKETGDFKGEKITYHDSCYLGRANQVYEIPRQILEALDAELVEMSRNRKCGLCCGAGGAQMFKEPEKGKTDINHERTKEAIQTQAKTIAVACPFCMTMMTDGVKKFEKENEIKVLDIAEIVLKHV
ncbi:MAG: (Fe-S)-binding protein [Cytophagales bacterium]|nr:(Fe-S)-binding protein [Cytophagales bacterium]MDW8383228.1 (Fe-S)-binding protein [Flammeovirgaceae bacterium]